MTASPTKISIIVPTRNRLELLPKIIDCYKNQTWKNKELLILDDSTDEICNIKHLENTAENISIYHSKEKLSIGRKRNQLIEHAKGELIAHFDDDDYYAPNYIETLAKALLASEATLVKLVGWFCYHEASNTLGYWDTTRQDIPNTIFAGIEELKTSEYKFTKNQNQSFLNGYGFSYMYRKSSWEKNRFKNINHGEDSDFFERNCADINQAVLLQDKTGICLHIIHKANTSRCFPNHIVPDAHKQKYFYFLKDKFNESTSANKAKGERKNTISFYPTRKTWEQDCPLVSICTITHNRRHFLPQLLKCIEAQDYPLKNIEWLILDDSTDYKDSPIIKTDTSLQIKYQRIRHKLPLGRKRNLSHQLCSGDYIVYMDDDDYYSPKRVSHAVSSLQQSEKEVAGSTLLQIYFCHDQQLWLSGPFGLNHATAGTFAMTKDFARQHNYRNEDTCNEEKYFLQNYTIPMVQLDPRQTMICISHRANTFDKKKMRSKGATRTMKRLKEETIDKDIARMLQEYALINSKAKNDSK